MVNTIGELGSHVRMSFPKRMLVAVSIIMLIVNLVMLYHAKDLSLDLVLVISAAEIIVVAVNFAYWVPKYRLKW